VDFLNGGFLWVVLKRVAGPPSCSSICNDGAAVAAATVGFDWMGRFRIDVFDVDDVEEDAAVAVDVDVADDDDDRVLGRAGEVGGEGRCLRYSCSALTGTFLSFRMHSSNHDPEIKRCFRKSSETSPWNELSMTVNAAEEGIGNRLHPAFCRVQWQSN